MVCPPFVYLWETGRLLKDTDVTLGAQSVCAEAIGAYTGEVSGAMLRDVGCSYVLVGHSERRQLYARATRCRAQFVAAQVHGLLPCCAWARRSRSARADAPTRWSRGSSMQCWR